MYEDIDDRNEIQLRPQSVNDSTPLNPVEKKKVIKIFIIFYNLKSYNLGSVNLRKTIVM